MTDFAGRYEEPMRELVEQLIRFDTTEGDERPAQDWFADYLAELGFETFTWTAEAATLAEHPSFPPADQLDVDDRPSVGGVLEFGTPDVGPTLVLNGHMDVVPVEDTLWSSDPFEPSWAGDRLTARGAVDMKSQLAAATYAARSLADSTAGVDGRVVVESVVGEEEGGIGTAAAMASNPYPFDRDAAIVAEPTDLRAVTATEGCLMKRLRIRGRPAHAARKWRGESVLPRFERVRSAFEELERERADRVTHPLYDRFEIPWPVVIGTVRAGNWASNVPGSLEAGMRIGVAPGESLAAVENEFDTQLRTVIEADDWLVAHPPDFDRFSIQFASAEIDRDEPVVAALQAAMAANGVAATEPHGETYGADARHFIEAGIPAVVFGPGRIEEAHFPDESIAWSDVVTAAAVMAGTAKRYLG